MNHPQKIPRHLAIIMDGNGRWAQKRNLPRIFGHRAGIKAVRTVIKACAKKRIEVLTIFAFSSENWLRPPQEVDKLMQLFLYSLQREIHKLHKKNIQVKFIGDRSRFSEELQNSIQTAQELTEHNTGLKLIIAANYGGRWDVTQAVQKITQQIFAGQINANDVTETFLSKYLTTADIPEPDLFIRTSGELRLSNFLIWQLAYTELYFTDTLWPDFDEKNLEKALEFFATRQRRFGGITG